MRQLSIPDTECEATTQVKDKEVNKVTFPEARTTDSTTPSHLLHFLFDCVGDNVRPYAETTVSSSLKTFYPKYERPCTPPPILYGNTYTNLRHAQTTENVKFFESLSNHCNTPGILQNVIKKNYLLKNVINRDGTDLIKQKSENEFDNKAKMLSFPLISSQTIASSCPYRARKTNTLNKSLKVFNSKPSCRHIEQDNHSDTQLENITNISNELKIIQQSNTFDTIGTSIEPSPLVSTVSLSKQISSDLSPVCSKELSFPDNIFNKNNLTLSSEELEMNWKWPTLQKKSYFDTPIDNIESKKLHIINEEKVTNHFQRNISHTQLPSKDEPSEWEHNPCTTQLGFIHDYKDSDCEDLYNKQCPDTTILENNINLQTYIGFEGHIQHPLSREIMDTMAVSSSTSWGDSTDSSFLCQTSQNNLPENKHVYLNKDPNILLTENSYKTNSFNEQMIIPTLELWNQKLIDSNVLIDSNNTIIDKHQLLHFHDICHINSDDNTNDTDVINPSSLITPCCLGTASSYLQDSHLCHLTLTPFDGTCSPKSSELSEYPYIQTPLSWSINDTITNNDSLHILNNDLKNRFKNHTHHVSNASLDEVILEDQLEGIPFDIESSSIPEWLTPKKLTISDHTEMMHYHVEMSQSGIDKTTEILLPETHSSNDKDDHSCQANLNVLLSDTKQVLNSTCEKELSVLNTIDTNHRIDQKSFIYPDILFYHTHDKPNLQKDIQKGYLFDNISPNKTVLSIAHISQYPQSMLTPCILKEWIPSTHHLSSKNNINEITHFKSLVEPIFTQSFKYSKCTTRSSSLTCTPRQNNGLTKKENYQSINNKNLTKQLLNIPVPYHTPIITQQHDTMLNSTRLFSQSLLNRNNSEQLSGTASTVFQSDHTDSSTLLDYPLDLFGSTGTYIYETEQESKQCGPLTESLKTNLLSEKSIVSDTPYTGLLLPNHRHSNISTPLNSSVIDVSFKDHKQVSSINENPFEENSSIDSLKTLNKQVPSIETLFCNHSDTETISVYPLSHEWTDFETKRHDLSGHVLGLARVQSGSRYLQRLLSRGTSDIISWIFEEIQSRITELMVDPYGNYLCQQLFESCTSEQRLLMLQTLSPTASVIACDRRGTHAMQSFIALMKIPEEEALLMKELQPHLLHMAMHPYGTHVIQRALICFHSPATDAMFEKIIQNLDAVSQDPHGLCVVKKAITRAGDLANETNFKEALLAKLSQSAMALIQSPFGNYAIQHAIQTWGATECHCILSQVKNHVVLLSTQKFSSNVVEHLIDVANPQDMVDILLQISSISSMHILMNSSYGNFVVKKALEKATNAQTIQLFHSLFQNILTVQNKRLKVKWDKILQSIYNRIELTFNSTDKNIFLSQLPISSSGLLNSILPPPTSENQKGTFSHEDQTNKLSQCFINISESSCENQPTTLSNTSPLSISVTSASTRSEDIKNGQDVLPYRAHTEKTNRITDYENLYLSNDETSLSALNKQPIIKPNLRTNSHSIIDSSKRKNSIEDIDLAKRKRGVANRKRATRWKK